MARGGLVANVTREPASNRPKSVPAAARRTVSGWASTYAPSGASEDAAHGPFGAMEVTVLSVPRVQGRRRAASPRLGRGTAGAGGAGAAVMIRVVSPDEGAVRTKLTVGGGGADAGA